MNLLSPKFYYDNILKPIFNPGRTRQLLSVNPVAPVIREEAREIKITVYEFNAEEIHEHIFNDINQCFRFAANTKYIHWINIDGLRKKDVEQISERFNIHPLLTEDILSIGQRPKMDDLNGILYSLLYMLYFNENNATVEQEQISIALGKNFVITFQEDAHRDVFKPLREKLKFANSKVRISGADYLCYSMLDLIVDHYFFVMEKLGDRMENLEEQIIRTSNKMSLARINQLRKELIVLRRNIPPVREIINGFIRSDSDLLEEQTTKYFKDIYDHIVQATDLAESYRDVMVSMQDLYLNNVNLKLNEVMKVMTIVTCLLAPAAVIGGIFGMNFDSHVEFFHEPWGFYTAVILMFAIPVLMIVIFKKRGWF